MQEFQTFYLISEVLCFEMRASCCTKLHNCNRWREPYTAEKRNGVQVFLPQGGKQK